MNETGLMYHADCWPPPGEDQAIVPSKPRSGEIWYYVRHGLRMPEVPTAGTRRSRGEDRGLCGQTEEREIESKQEK